MSDLCWLEVNSKLPVIILQTAQTVYVWFNWKLLRPPPHMQNRSMHVEEGGDGNGTKEMTALPSSTSVYVTPVGISSFNWDTIMLSKEPLEEQLNPLHMSGIVCLCPRGRGVQRCTYVSPAAQMRFPYMYYASPHFWMLTRPDVPQTERACAPTQRTYIWARRTSCLLRRCK